MDQSTAKRYTDHTKQQIIQVLIVTDGLKTGEKGKGKSTNNIRIQICSEKDRR